MTSQGVGRKHRRSMVTRSWIFNAMAYRGFVFLHRSTLLDDAPLNRSKKLEPTVLESHVFYEGTRKHQVVTRCSPDSWKL